MRAKRIACYLANDGEIDPAQLMDTAFKSGKQCFLPVLHPLQANQLCFIEYTPRTKLVPNKFGILEPAFNNTHMLFSCPLLALIGRAIVWGWGVATTTVPWPL
jgi:5-formyltetrahydrofolate cyclo-ligase